jgi:oligo-alginate lyase
MERQSKSMVAATLLRIKIAHPFLREHARIIALVVALLTVAMTDGSAQGNRPHMVVSAADIQAMREALGKVPLFDQAYADAKETVDRALARPMDVPVPKDAGGYTHEKHKQNYVEMQLAGILYQVSKDERYAIFIRDMLLKYAALYPTLGRHPMTASAEYGRLFWQTLNENVWMVHVAQAYDCIYDWLSPSDRAVIETKLLRPMVQFFTSEHAATVDRIHNHGTWMVAAVGMLGYALHDQNLVDIALYGTKKDKTAGFLRQMDLLFSPDGYYTEGAYYARYAIMPFILFAQAIQNNQPELNVFKYRNQILKNAVDCMLQLTDPNARYIPINDAAKDMSILSRETVLAVDVAYASFGGDKGLLALAQKQGRITLDGAGLAVARALQREKGPLKFGLKSVEYTDGAAGDEGAIGILRSASDSDQSMLVMKYTAQGFGHGHYDKLSVLFYDQNREILQDYGFARFINVEPKFGGRYLPENETWAKQTIAHNTVTVDGESHYGGVYKVAQQNHADRHFFSVSDPNIQIMSGKAIGVHKGVVMQRTMAIVRDNSMPKPLILDVFRIESTSKHRYDLPFYYLGHLVFTNVPYRAFDSSRTRLGSANGYQHLWNEAEGAAAGTIRCTWLEGGRYYSIISAADSATKVFFTRIGASDPNFNLRNEPGIMLRRTAASTVFATVLEPHGTFEPVDELSIGAAGRIQDVKVLASTAEATIIDISGTGALHWVIAVVNGNASDEKEHSATAGGKTFSWKGNYQLWKY